MRTPLALLAATAVLAPAIARAQPVDPYGPDPAPPVGDPPPGVTDDRDPEVDEAVAASLVARAKQLMSVEEWADAKQLLGEAIVRSPDGAAAAEAKPLMDEVNLKLGIAPKVDTVPVDPYADDQVGIGDPIDPGMQAPEVPPMYPPPARNGGKKFLLHATALGAVIGGFLGDAATADVQPTEVDGDPVNTEDSGGVIAGVLLGGLGGLAIGAGFRHSPWMTTDDIMVIDSFAAMGLLGSLGLAGVMQPVESEGYSVNAVLGTAAGAVTGFVIAKKRDLSGRRMRRVDLWAAGGALVPWLVFAAAKGNADGAQVAGFFSMAGLAGGAWLGFRLTRHWDERRGASATVDAPMALIQRHSDGGWTLGPPAIAPAQGGGATGTVLGVAW